MKKIITLFLLTIGTFSVSAQSFGDVSENRPYVENGVEYSYTVTNESIVKEYNRYEVTIMATNKSGCPLVYIKKDDISSLFEGDPSAIARFECINANGKRLTAKGGNLRARAFYVPNKRTVTGPDGKTTTTTERIHAGYILGNGQTVSTQITVLTDGEKPRFKVRTQNFTDLSVY